MKEGQLIKTLLSYGFYPEDKTWISECGEYSIDFDTMAVGDSSGNQRFFKDLNSLIKILQSNKTSWTREEVEELCYTAFWFGQPRESCYNEFKEKYL
jgi:hypothetical protein